MFVLFFVVFYYDFYCFLNFKYWFVLLLLLFHWFYNNLNWTCIVFLIRLMTYLVFGRFWLVSIDGIMEMMITLHDVDWIHYSFKRIQWGNHIRTSTGLHRENKSILKENPIRISIQRPHQARESELIISSRESNKEIDLKASSGSSLRIDHFLKRTS